MHARWIAWIGLAACDGKRPTPADAPPPPVRVVAHEIIELAVGADHTCALRADGAVSCWGSNERGQLGVGGRTDRTQPIDVEPPGDAIQISAAGDRTCVLHARGDVACWGQLAGSFGHSTVAIAPVAQLSGACMRTRTGAVACLDERGAVAPIAGVEALDVAGSVEAGCAVTTAHDVACWDANRRAKRIVGVADAVQVAVGDLFACARLRDGHVSCWGVELAGRLGRSARLPIEPRVTMREVPLVWFAPAPIANVDDAIALVVAGTAGCVVRRDRSAACWGTHGLGAPLPQPAQIGVTGVDRLALGTKHACALRGTDVECWGSDLHGQVGDGWSSAHPDPIDVPELDDAVELDDSCARRRTGKVACWGSSGWRAQLPTQLDGIAHDLAGLRDIASGAGTTVVDRAGTVWESYGGLPERAPVPPAVQTSQRCAVTRTHAVWCWGPTHPSSDYVHPDPTPRAIPGIDDALAVYDAPYRTCVVRSTGAITCVFGDDLHDGFDLRHPITVPIVTDAIAVSMGDAYYVPDCAIRADLSVWCWRWDLAAYNSGDPKPGGPSLPAPHAIDLHDAVSVAVGIDHVCAARSDGTVVCFGTNDLGQLGDGTLASHPDPAKVVGVDDAVSVSAGYKFSCALRRTGHVACWGRTDGGEVGTVATAWVARPVSVRGL